MIDSNKPHFKHGKSPKRKAKGIVKRRKKTNNTQSTSTSIGINTTTIDHISQAISQKTSIAAIKECNNIKHGKKRALQDIEQRQRKKRRITNESNKKRESSNYKINSKHNKVEGSRLHKRSQRTMRSSQSTVTTTTTIPHLIYDTNDIKHEFKRKKRKFEDIETRERKRKRRRMTHKSIAKKTADSTNCNMNRDNINCKLISNEKGYKRSSQPHTVRTLNPKREPPFESLEHHKQLNFKQLQCSNRYDIECNTDTYSGQKSQQTANKVFDIDELCVNIFLYVEIKELIIFRRICQNFNKLLSFKYSLNKNGELYFYYNNLFVLQMIEKNICNYDTLGYWWIQTVNFQTKKMTAVPDLDATKKKRDLDSKNKHNSNGNEKHDSKNNTNKTRSCTNNSYNKYKYIVTIKEDEPARDIWRIRDIGNCCVLQAVYDYLVCIKEEIDEIEFYGIDSYMIDYLILGYNFNIKPIKKYFVHLLNENKLFQNELCHMYHVQSTKSSDPNRAYKVQVLNSLFTAAIEFINPPCLFAFPTKGFLAFFMFCSLKGDFKVYQDFLKYVCHNNGDKIKDCGITLDCMVGMLCLFMRQDLIENYIYHNQVRGRIATPMWSLYLLLKPDMLRIHKERLLSQGISFNDHDLFEFDLINNQRYHPIQRLKLLKKLCFCSEIGVSLGTHIGPDTEGAYSTLRQQIIKLYEDFSYFQCEWHLTEYNDLRNDTDEQHKLHCDFKIIIHSLLVFGSLYLTVDRTNGENIIEAMIRPNIDNYNIKLNEKNKLCDIVCPQNEDELQSLYEILKQGRSDDDIASFTRQPYYDQIFEYNATKKRWSDTDKAMIFEQINEPYLLLYKMWKITFT